jgi:hypothetical protein
MKASLTEVERNEILAKGYANPGYFCRTFLPEWFFLPMPWVHRGLLAILTEKTDWLLEFGHETWARGEGEWTPRQLDKILRHFVWKPEPDNPASPVYPLFTAERDAEGNITALHLSTSNRVLVIMPRGISKTTIVNASNLYDICYDETKFLVYLSEAATHAEMQLENVKRELSGNEAIKMVFGQKKPDRSSEEKWTQGFIETTDGQAVAAKGRGGQVRGLNHEGHRPEKIVIDDVEDLESVKTEDQKKKTRVWLKSDVEPALPQIGNRRGRIIATGTILAADALLPTLMKDPEWVTVIFGAIDPDGDALWDHYMTVEQYEKKKQGFIRIGQLAEFLREYQSSLKAEGPNVKFPQDTIRYQVMNRTDFIGVALVMDPAIGQKKDSDYISYAVVGMTEKGQMHVMESVLERGLTPRQQIDTYFELVDRYNPTKFGIESVAYQKALVFLVREEQFRKSQTMGMKAYFEIIPILHGITGKIPRVEGALSPRYKAGYVTHQRRFPVLEQQLLEWPNSKKDGPDSVAMAVTLLDPYAAFAIGGEPDAAGNDQLARDQYQPIEEALGGDFRSAP